jgi:hypothetical protein
MTERKRRFDVAPEDEPTSKTSAIAVDAAAAVAALRNPTGSHPPSPPPRPQQEPHNNLQEQQLPQQPLQQSPAIHGPPHPVTPRPSS